MENQVVPTQVVRLAHEPQFRELFPVLYDYDAGMVAGSYALHSILDYDPSWTPSDIDFFLHDKPDYSVSLTRITSQLIGLNYEVSFVSEKALSFRRPYSKKVQIILPIQGITTLEEGLSRFDVSVSRCAFLSVDEVAVHVTAEEDIKNRQFRMLNSVSPLVDMTRVLKYTYKGFSPHPVNVINIMDAWAENRPDYHETKEFANKRLNFGGSG
jgi:hypothetical protein